MRAMRSYLSLSWQDTIARCRGSHQLPRNAQLAEALRKGRQQLASMEEDQPVQIRTLAFSTTNLNDKPQTQAQTSTIATPTARDSNAANGGVLEDRHRAPEIPTPVSHTDAVPAAEDQGGRSDMHKESNLKSRVQPSPVGRTADEYTPVRPDMDLDEVSIHRKERQQDRHVASVSADDELVSEEASPAVASATVSSATVFAGSGEGVEISFSTVISGGGDASFSGELVPSYGNVMNQKNEKRACADNAESKHLARISELESCLKASEEASDAKVGDLMERIEELESSLKTSSEKV